MRKLRFIKVNNFLRSKYSKLTKHTDSYPNNLTPTVSLNQKHILFFRNQECKNVQSVIRRDKDIYDNTRVPAERELNFCSPINSALVLSI